MEWRKFRFPKLTMHPSPRVLMAGAALIVVCASGAAYYFYSQAKNPGDTAQREVDIYVARVGRLMVLPDNEVPVIATVADPSKLQGQPFFVNAKKGDKVLLYNSARKAILYDPEADRIVNVAPLSTGGQSSVSPTP